MSACRSCGAAVEFALTAKGASIPLDVAEVEPAPGAIRLVDGHAHSYASVPEDDRGRGTWHLSHFATCPQADTWRRKR